MLLWGKQRTGCQYHFLCTNVSRQDIQAHEFWQNRDEKCQQVHYRRSEIAVESLAGLKEVVSHPKETGTLIRKTAPQNFKEHELKVPWHQQSIKIFSIHIQLAMCDLSSEEFKIAILNNSVCYRKYNKILEQKQENNKQWTKQAV